MREKNMELLVLRHGGGTRLVSGWRVVGHFVHATDPDGETAVIPAELVDLDATATQSWRQLQAQDELEEASDRPTLTRAPAH